jgi:predicted Holliday junction resolvase-like endonuclease
MENDDNIQYHLSIPAECKMLLIILVVLVVLVIVVIARCNHILLVERAKSLEILETAKKLRIEAAKDLARSRTIQHAILEKLEKLSEFELQNINPNGSDWDKIKNNIPNSI